MSRITGLLALVFALVLPLMSAPPGLAIDLSNDRGEQIFSSNCAACHMGGGNVIRASRTLKIRDLNAHLEEYQQDPLEAIEHQIEDGKNAMPSYAGKLSEAEIIAVATFVEQQAELGW
ncbi:c-type cytochrome [Synechococcus sp. CC9616]|jgi:cytochrome c6|uniref:c-type cytochrome n=1 Tax=Synechococcus sp. CC9616 TaxID=110663 RepID=UPI000031CA21|nr:c-type cytochrome [Synechococcus sp. CC9616]|tara:strand:+ start:1156 stop:1509 length:354 start_codon:yes stop_codon:yes gene_type:complete